MFFFGVKEMSGKSFALLPSQEVKNLALSCLERISKHRAIEEQECIDTERQRLQCSWVHKLFKTRIPSDEEIRQSLTGDGWFFGTIPSIYGWKSKEIAEKLIKLANKTDQIFVSTEDLDYIS